jgi:hypothetical protein
MCEPGKGDGAFLCPIAFLGQPRTTELPCGQAAEGRTVSIVTPLGEAKEFGRSQEISDQF